MLVQVITGTTRQARFGQTIDRADGFVVLTAEYNQDALSAARIHEGAA